MTQISQSVKAENDPSILMRVRTFLNELNSGTGRATEQLNPIDVHQISIDAQKSVMVDYSGIEEFEITINHDGEEVSLHITKSVGIGTDAPVFLFVHGGGWVLGDFQTYRRIVKDLVVQTGAVCIFPAYTLSPEARYPIAIRQIFATLKWMSGYGNETEVDGSDPAIVGNGVDGNMAASVALMAKRKSAPSIRLKVWLWPVNNVDLKTSSYKEFGEGRFLTRNTIEWFWSNYLPDKKMRKEINASPL